MKHDFLPRSDAKMLEWAEGFILELMKAPGPEGFGVSAAEAAAYGALVAGYRQAYERAKHGSTRGPAAVVAKNEAKRALVAESRRLARLVSAQPGLTGTQRVDLGLGPGHGGVGRREAVARPSAAPSVYLAGTEGDTVRLRLSDHETTGRKRPEGVHGAMLFYYVGERLPRGWSDWAFGLSTTATRFGFTLPRTWGGEHVALGAKVWLAACWVNPTLETGPMSTPIYTRGGISEAPEIRRLGLAA